MTQLWPHQEAAVQMALELDGTLLHHEMGTGKTLTAITLMDRLNPERTLIVAPNSVVPVWPYEFVKHLGPSSQFRVVAPRQGDVTRRARMAKDMMQDDGCTVLVVNYEAARMGAMAKLILTTPWDLIILDEAHRIKGAGTKIANFMRKLRLANPDSKRLALTGTPMPHSFVDAWSLTDFLEPGLLGKSLSAFKWRYAIYDPYVIVNNRQVRIIGMRDQADFQSRLSAITHQVRKDEVLDLPEQHHVELRVDLPDDAWRSYRELERLLITELEQGVVTAANVLVKTTRLAQFTSGFGVTEDGTVVDIHKAKEQALKELLDGIGSDRNVVVFCRFRHDLDVVLRVAQACGRPTDECSGRARTFDSPWRPEKGTVLAAQIQAAAEGIDLTAAWYSVYYSQVYSLGQYEQSLARQHRQGQRHNVTVYHLLAAHTIDERIREILVERKDIVEELLKGL